MKRPGSLVALILSSILLLAACSAAAPAAGVVEPAGRAPYFAGGDGSQHDIKAMATFESALYVGTYHWLGGCEVWCYDASGWTRVANAGFGNPENDGVSSMTVYDSMLYAGTSNWDEGCEIWRFDGVDWTRVEDGGLGDRNNHAVSSLAVFDGTLYAGIQNSHNGCEIWRTGGGDAWEMVVGDGFGDGANGDAASMWASGAALFAGTFNAETGCEVWRSTDGTTFNQVNQDGFGDDFNSTASSLLGFDGRLYAGTWNNHSGCEVWRRDGPNPGDWSLVAAGGLGDDDNVDASSMDVFDGALHLGTHNQETGCQVWRSNDGTDFTRVNEGGFGEIDNLDASSMAPFAGGLYVGTKDWERGCEVWRSEGSGGTPYTDWEKVAMNGLAGATWYAAEGSSAGGFETWILVQNPSAGEAHVSLTYMTAKGAVPGPDFDLEPGSRQSVEVAATVEAFDVSTEVTSNRPVVVERAVYWNGRQCGTGSLGATSAASTWYLAEGSTAGGFETWLLLLNPGTETADVRVDYFTGGGIVFGPQLELEPGTRRSVDVSASVETFDVSTMVLSDTPIVAERAVYFDDRRCATGSIGGTDSGNAWYVAEGCTGPGFETWLLIMNPSSDAAEVRLTYMTDEGEVKGPKVTVPGYGRTSVDVSETVETWDVSTFVTSDLPVVVERAVYFDDRACATGSVGSMYSGNTWYVAEGSTAGGFETWILVQNPGDRSARVALTYMTGEGETPGPEFDLAPGSRRSIEVAKTVETFDVSTSVTSSRPVVVERALYFDDRSCATGSVGFDAF